MKIIQRFGAVFLIIAVTLVVYAPALRNGFVWDDTALVLRDPLIRSWRLIPQGFQHHLFVDATASNFYRPIQRLVFTGNYALFGLNPAGWHFVSIAAHAAAAVALYAFLSSWWGHEKRRWALGVVLVWAVHPIHTSAVTYVAGLADPLAALCGFTALTLAWRSLRDNRSALAWAAGLVFLAAMLCKESGVGALLVWALMFAWQRPGRDWWLRWLAIVAVIVTAYFGLRMSAQKTPPPGADPSIERAPRIVLVSRALAQYAQLVVAPVQLQMERDITPDAKSSHLLTVAGGVLLAALGALAWWCRRNAPPALLALCAAGLTYFPISNVFRLNATAAEHWLYVPSALLFAAIALIAQAANWSPALRRVLLGLLCGWTLAMGVRTFVRQPDWHNQETFYRQTIAAGGDSARMHLNLGNLSMRAGDSKQAIEEFQRALAMGSASKHAWFSLASTYHRLGDYSRARHALAQCAGSKALAAEVIQLSTAIDLAELKKDPTDGFRRAAELAPLNWSYRKRYLQAVAQYRGLPTAIEELRHFIAEQDFRADSWVLLADFLRQAGIPELAAQAQREAELRDVRLGETPPRQ